MGVIVGISRYRDLRGVPNLVFADADARGIAGPRFTDVDRPVLMNEKALTGSMIQAVTHVLSQAGPKDQVFLFISARGVATPDLADGFILGFDSPRDHPANNSLSVHLLGDLIAKSKAGHVFVFADVSRAPTELTGENRINYNLQDLEKGNRNLSIILASEPKHLSQEDPALKHGVFGNFLIQWSTQAATASAQDVFTYLRDEVRKYTNSAQKPWSYGDPPPRTIVQPISRVFGRSDVLLAFFGPPAPGLLAGAFDDADSPAIAPEDRPEFARLEQLLRTGSLDGFDGVKDLVRSLEPSFPGSDRVSIAVALENSGQQTLVRYGEGDQFPDDPLRPKKQDFDRASELFALALHERTLVKASDPDFDRVSRSLMSRIVFCQGRSLILDSKFQAALDRLHDSIEERKEADWLAETYNVKGIAHLELAQYDEASKAFVESLKLAPDWAYARHNLALTHIESGDYAAAQRDYRTAIKRTPYHPYLYYNLGVLLHRLNRKKDAAQAYLLSIDKFQLLQSSYEKRAKQWETAKVPDQAERALAGKRVLELNEAEAHNALGAVRQAQGDFKHAEEQYTASRELNTNLNSATYNLGALYADWSSRRGKGQLLDRGIDLLEKAVSNDPGLLPAQLKLTEAKNKRLSIQTHK